jgi:ketosteroid isomerase-like protein
MLATFAPGAVVNDHRCDFRGDAVRTWAATEIVGDRVTIAVTAVTRCGNAVAVDAAVDGNFAKASLPSPFVLTFYFTIEGEQLAQLVIVYNQPSGKPAAGSVAALDANRRVARRFFELFAAGDVAATMALFADNATYWFPTIRKTFTKPELADGLHWIQSPLAGQMKFELGPMVAEGNMVAVQAESFATTTEGVAFNNLYHLYFEIADGSIARAREYNDTAHVFATLRAGQPRTGA